MIVWGFPILAAFGISAAYFLKARFSGSDLNYARFYFCLAFNGVFVVPYMDILQNDDFLFLGHRPEIISEHPFVGWIAFSCIFIHLFALPVKRKVKGWFARN
ncbi:hypothetical protein [Pseudomonas chlororaphis]|uniref:hypothetical protein n=1 Tax=Pseudomonas chlororaphis TaxID=587753 RepID=UPI000F565580|nr:hypothetical protein [Pseudomonas chlororaphis]QTT88523.1 hypothetical protein HUT28_14490 [Pseudomonas chlororaphis]